MWFSPLANFGDLAREVGPSSATGRYFGRGEGRRRQLGHQRNCEAAFRAECLRRAERSEGLVCMQGGIAVVEDVISISTASLFFCNYGLSLPFVINRAIIPSFVNYLLYMYAVTYSVTQQHKHFPGAKAIHHSQHLNRTPIFVYLLYYWHINSALTYPYDADSGEGESQRPFSPLFSVP